MPQQKLTQHNVSRLDGPEPGKSETIYWDEAVSRFGLRVLQSGTRTYIVRCRFDGKQRVEKVGRADVISLDDARIKARGLLLGIDQAKKGDGLDPRAERTKRLDRKAATFGKLVGDYIKDSAPKTQKPRTLLETRRYLVSYSASLHPRPVHEIEREDIAKVIQRVAKEHGAISANRFRAALSAMFAWGMGEGRVGSNPVVGTNKPGKEQKRRRILGDKEIAAIWNAANGGGDYDAIVRLLFLTGQRREEVAGMRWSEIDLHHMLWSLPGSRTKNGEPHNVPLSDEAARIISESVYIDNRDVIFGRGVKGFSGWSQAKRRFDERCGVNDWRLHDIRRTVATGMSNIKVPPHVVEAALNHLSGFKAGVAGVYNYASYDAEKREALCNWSNHIAELVMDHK